MIAIGLIQIAILLVALLRAKGLAILLGPEGVGLIGTLDQLIVTVTQVAAFGLPIAAMKSMSAAHSTSDEAFRDCFAAFVRVILGLALVATVIGFFLMTFAPGLLAGFHNHGSAVPVAMLSVPAMMLTILIAQTLAAAQMARRAAVYNFCFLSSVALSGLTGVWLGGLQGFYYGTAIAGSAAVVLGLAWLSRKLGLSIFRKGVSIRHQFSLRPNVFSTALTASISLVSFSVTMLMVRSIVLVNMGEEPTGFLQAAIAVALSLGSVLATINALQLAPSMNREQPNSERFQRGTDFANRVALLAMMGAVPVALLPGLGLTVLFTSEFVPGGLALVLCLIWQTAHQLRVTCLQLLISTDHPLSGASAMVLATAVAVGVTMMLIAPLGILAAPIGLIAGDVVAILVMLVRLRGVVAMPVPGAVLARFLGAFAAILGAGLLFDPTVVLPELSGVALRLAYTLVGIALIWLTMPSHLSPAAALAWLRNRQKG